MKMKNVITMKSLSAAMVAGILILASCSKSNDNPLSSTDTQNVNSESVSSSTSSETSDLANAVISNVSDSQLSGARVAGQVVVTGLEGKDGRLKGATITITGTGTKTNPSGTVTIDYGTQGVTTNGVTRKGEIIVAYTGRRLQPQSKRTITFNAFSRNDVTVKGSYTVTVMDSSLTNTDFKVTFSHATDLNLTFPDGKSITRTAAYNVAWDYVFANPLQSTITQKAGGGATGTTKNGANYTMAVVTDIVYRADCLASGMFLPISGEKTISVTASQSSTPVVYTIDFATATGTACPSTIKVSVNGKSKEIQVSADGN